MLTGVGRAERPEHAERRDAVVGGVALDHRAGRRGDGEVEVGDAVLGGGHHAVAAAGPERDRALDALALRIPALASVVVARKDAAVVAIEIPLAAGLPRPGALAVVVRPAAAPRLRTLQRGAR